MAAGWCTVVGEPTVALGRGRRAGTRAQVATAIQRGTTTAWLRWREELGGVGTGAVVVSLWWHAVAGGAEELRRRWLGLGHDSERG